jgi:DNA-directed RNA polymerase specialized sigma24 family protein
MDKPEVATLSSNSDLRTDIAGRMVAHRDVLVARIRRRLDTRACLETDADDVFSTTLRRMDALAASGDLVERMSDDHLLALASAIAHNAVRERARRTGRERSRLRTVGVARHEVTSTNPLEDPAKDPADTLVLLDERGEQRARAEALLLTLLASDLQILGLRLRGADWSTIASELGTTPGAAHRRYFRALERLASLATSSDPPS